eukprot:SAG11_NODE_6_length_32111_cov_33.703174_7_plen_171_part_00
MHQNQSTHIGDRHRDGRLGGGAVVWPTPGGTKSFNWVIVTAFLCSLACFFLLTVGASSVGAERHLARWRCRDYALGKNWCARSRRAQSSLTLVLGSSGGILTGVALVCSCYDHFFCNVAGRWANRIWSPERKQCVIGKAINLLLTILIFKTLPYPCTNINTLYNYSIYFT